MTIVFYFFLTVLIIQVIWLVMFGVAFTSDHPRGRIVNETVPVSLIVCAHDEEHNLRALIPILLEQDHPSFELIIVDDRSNDGTYDFLLDLTKTEPRVRLVRVTNLPPHINGKKYALTLGIRAARYDVILLTDADCRPGSRGWINTMVSHFKPETSIVIGFSPYVRKSGVLNSFIRFETFLTAIQYMGLALLGKPYMGVGRNLAYRKSLFLNSKGFNDHLDVTGGDDDLFVNQHGNALNVAVAIGKETLTHSVPKETWGGYFVQKLRHLSVGRRYRRGDRLLLATFTLSWILSWGSPLALLSFDSGTLIIAFVFLVRWIVMLWVFNNASRKLGEPFETWKVPLLDFIYAFYYLVAGPVALLSKKVRWKI